MTAELPMSRARLFSLIDAFERDLKDAVEKYVVADLGEEAALGDLYADAAARRSSDGMSVDDAAISDYLDLRPTYDLLNRHRANVPTAFAAEVRELTSNLDRLVAIRNRVMHARPLKAGDPETAVSLLQPFTARQWARLTRTLAQLQDDPSWEPRMGPVEESGLALHNLPLPDYDDTGLVGRDKEVEELVKLLKRRREPVLTVTGEGGIGKTALALTVAYEMVDDPDRTFDAVLWTSLKFEKLTAAGIQVISSAARELVGALQPIGSAIDANFRGSAVELASMLDGFETLVIIDNLETVSGTEFTELYEALPDSVSYLITSRLGVGEFERRYPLGQLPEKDSLRLFNDLVRARSVGSISRISGAARAEVVRRLRHSPLAIRWFVLSVEAGHDPLQLIHHQDDLLEFCVRSVFASLGESARAVLMVLRSLERATTFDELVVLSESGPDQVSAGLQELLRGALIQRSAENANGLTQAISLTETASQFLGQRVEVDAREEAALAKKQREYQETESRRARDIDERSLGPMVVRPRTKEDEPTCQLLRKAMLASQKEDYERAFDLLGQARRLRPDFWEVDRVEGFIRATRQELAAALSCYERAYKSCTGVEQAVVAYFYAGCLARSGDLVNGIRLAQQAHAEFASAETAVNLGRYLAWLGKYKEAIDLIEPIAAAKPDGRLGIIALDTLADTYERWAENTRGEERNPALAYVRARKGYSIPAAAMSSGIADLRLRDSGAKCLALALSCAAQALRTAPPVEGLSEWTKTLEAQIVRFTTSRQWPRLLAAIEFLSSTPKAPQNARRLAEVARSLDPATTTEVADGADVAGMEFVGEVMNVSHNYGFIRTPAFPKNVFFHRGDMENPTDFVSLRVGATVRFGVEIGEKGPKGKLIRMA